MIFNDIFCQDVRAPAPAINQAAGLISIIPTSPQRGLLQQGLEIIPSLIRFQLVRGLME